MNSIEENEMFSSIHRPNSIRRAIYITDKGKSQRSFHWRNWYMFYVTRYLQVIIFKHSFKQTKIEDKQPGNFLFIIPNQQTNKKKKEE